MLSLVTFVLVLAADPIPKETGTPRQPNPFAPSLPLLTSDEEKQLDSLIDRFIQADTGKLTGADAKKALDEFKELGPEASFALIRGFNRSAPIDHSCPALTIGRKLGTILRSSSDISLLQFAKENIGAGVKTTRHGDIIRDLKIGCTQRITAIKNAPIPEIRISPKP